jgi:hypothetical protein
LESVQVSTLLTFGGEYQQAKADRKINLFLKLARIVLWCDSPLVVPSTVEDESTYRNYAGWNLEEVKFSIHLTAVTQRLLLGHPEKNGAAY